MCRWAAYAGPEIWLENLVTSPAHSLVRQSHDANEAKIPTNGDGFGIAWYGARRDPGVYRDILPAWSDSNLASLCRHIRSGMFMAHVRAATDGEISRANSHPFTSGRWSFVHNGRIGGFDRLRRRLEAELSDEAFARRLGTTDSELLFLLALDAGLDDDPHLAIMSAVGRVLSLAAEENVDQPTRLTAAFCDGERLCAVRYATDTHAPTLYSAGPLDHGGYCLVSEPLDHIGNRWASIPDNSFVTVTKNGVTVTEFRPDLQKAA